MTVAAPARPRAPRRAFVLVALLLAIPFLFELYGAVGDLVTLLAYANAIGAGLSTFVWLVLAITLLIPVAAYVLALLVARRRAAASAALILIVVYCASQALTLSVLALYQSATHV